MSIHTKSHCYSVFCFCILINPKIPQPGERSVQTYTSAVENTHTNISSQHIAAKKNLRFFSGYSSKYNRTSLYSCCCESMMLPLDNGWSMTKLNMHRLLFFIHSQYEHRRSMNPFPTLFFYYTQCVITHGVGG